MARERRHDGGYSLHVKPCGRLKRRTPAADSGGDHRAVEATRRLQESLVVVKESGDPDFPASMAEMIAADDDVRASARGLEEPLACYLTFNDAEHNPAIVAAFRLLHHLLHG